MTTIDRAALRARAEDCKTFTGLMALPPHDVLALLDALDAAEAREAALRELVDSLWKSQHQYHGGSRKSCRFEWCQHIVAALAVEP